MNLRQRKKQWKRHFFHFMLNGKTFNNFTSNDVKEAYKSLIRKPKRENPLKGKSKGKAKIFSGANRK